MSDRKIYANFNQFSVTGRIFSAEIVTRTGSPFLSATVITNCVKDDEVGTTVSFTNSNGLMALFQKGLLPVGREVTLTGHISEVSSTYVKDGQVYDRKRPDIQLESRFRRGRRLPADKAVLCSSCCRPALALSKQMRLLTSLRMPQPTATTIRLPLLPVITVCCILPTDIC